MKCADIKCCSWTRVLKSDWRMICHPCSRSCMNVSQLPDRWLGKEHACHWLITYRASECEHIPQMGNLWIIKFGPLTLVLLGQPQWLLMHPVPAGSQGDCAGLLMTWRITQGESTNRRYIKVIMIFRGGAVVDYTKFTSQRQENIY